MTNPAALALLCGFGLVACDGGASAGKAAGEAKANDEKKDPEFEKRMAERREKRLAKEKAKADAETQRAASIDAVCILPGKLPKKLNVACQAVSDAHDGFMKRQYADEPDTLTKWTTASGTQLPMTYGQCNKSRSLKVAACQKHALDNAPPELKKELPEILKVCNDKFGTGGTPRGPALPKRRPQ